MPNPTGKGGWKKGQSGNPNGRPKKGDTYTDALRSKIDADKLAERVNDLILNGDAATIRWAYDRFDGKPIETVNQNVREMPQVVGYYPDDDATDSEDTEPGGDSGEIQDS